MLIADDLRIRLYPVLKEMVARFKTPFIIHDELGARRTVREMQSEFDDCGFKQFFAVKANPLPAILRIMKSLDCGLDCSQGTELIMGRRVGFSGEDLICTSNDTSQELFRTALADGGCILNLDDITMINKVPVFPKLISFRFNPGERRLGGEYIGNPKDSKYGVRYDQMIDSYQQAIERGAERFGIHTMIYSNNLKYTEVVETVRMLLEVIEMISKKLGIKFEFMNIGGGIGIPATSEVGLFNLSALAEETKILLHQFGNKYGYIPRLFTECGRYITGPHGVLVTTAIHRMSKYREFVGVDASMVDFMRPAIYGEDGGGYHPITVFGGEERPIEIVSISGSACENCDCFCVNRSLPRIKEGDLILLWNAGAHGRAMGSNYNGLLRCKELILHPDGSVSVARRAETVEDYFATLDFNPEPVWL